MNIQTIISNLPGNATDFQRCCQVRLCADDLSARVNAGLVQGQKLLDDIQAAMDHLTAIQFKLEGRS